MPRDSCLQDLNKCFSWSLSCMKTSLGSYSSNSEMVVETEDRSSGFDIHILKAELIEFTEEPKLWHERTQGGGQWFCCEPSGKMELQLTELEWVWRKSQFSSRYIKLFNQRFTKCSLGTHPCGSLRLSQGSLVKTILLPLLPELKQILAQNPSTPPLNRN